MRRASITSGCRTARRSRKAASSDEVLAALRAKGHEVRTGGRQGDAHSIWVAPDGTPYGVNDTRIARLEGLGRRRI